MRVQSIDQEIAGAPSATVPAAPEPAAIDWRRVLLAETGPGAVEAYDDHPLNLLRSRPMAYVLRGLTGLAQALGVESLRLAIVDIVMGLVQVMLPGRLVRRETP